MQHFSDHLAAASSPQEAGYSPRLITHHFGSKAALAERLIRRNLHEFLFVAEANDGGHELEALVAVVKAYFAWMSRNEEARAYFVLCSAGLTEDAELRPVFISIDATFRTGLQTIVRAGHRAGRHDARNRQSVPSQSRRGRPRHRAGGLQAVHLAHAGPAPGALMAGARIVEQQQRTPPRIVKRPF